MNYLLLSPFAGLSPALPHSAFTFTGGEPHLKLGPEALAAAGTAVCVAVRVRNSADLLLSLLAKDALDRAGFQQIELFIPYFPGARQDRVMVPGEPLSAKVYANLINAARFSRVTIFDPHSEVTPALLDRCRVISNAGFIREVIGRIPDARQLTLVAPDAGAAKKIHALAASLDWPRTVQCDKIRDVRSGQLSGARVFAEDLAGADCLIVDDICDGGGTFLQLADALRARNAGRLFLAVSHGIFSKGTQALSERFERIFTTDSFYEGGMEQVESIEMGDFGF